MTKISTLKVTKLPKYKKELINDIVNKTKFMLKDIFSHLDDWNYEIATYTYSHPGNLEIYFHEKLVVSLVVTGDFPRIEAINNVIYPADKPNVYYDNVSYITSRFYQLTKNTYKGDRVFATSICFNPSSKGLRIVASDGTRYLQE